MFKTKQGASYQPRLKFEEPLTKRQMLLENILGPITYKTKTVFIALAIDLFGRSLTSKSSIKPRTTETLIQFITNRIIPL
jgi:hypothetical protein